jgi:hypothetical protein
MSATAAAGHRHVFRRNLQPLARLINHLKGEATVDTTADIVPLFATRLMRPRRSIALVAAMLVIFFLIWIFARDKVEWRTVADKHHSYWEQRFYQQQKRRQVDRGELVYAPGAANEWYVHSYDVGIAQNYHRIALLTLLSSVGPTLIEALPICNVDGRFTETDVPAQKYYGSSTKTFDTRPAYFDGSNHIAKERLELLIANTTGSYAKPFYENPQWQASAPFTVTCSNANSNVPDIAVTGGADPNDEGGYTSTRFGTSTQRVITKDWWGALNAVIPTQWRSEPPAELMFGPGARVVRFHQNVTTYSRTAEPSILHSLTPYGPDVSNVVATSRFHEKEMAR